MGIFFYVSVTIIIIFVILYLVISQLKSEYGGGIVSNAIETFKNCCKRLFGKN